MQRDQTLPLSAKGVACETNTHTCGSNSTDSQLSNVDILHSRWYRESDKLEIVLEKKTTDFAILTSVTDSARKSFYIKVGR